MVCKNNKKGDRHPIMNIYSFDFNIYRVEMYYSLTQIYFCMPELFQMNVSNQFLSTKSPFGFVF